MSIKKITRESLGNWVDALIAKQRVFGVKAKGDRFVYDLLGDASELRLDFDVTIMPPKKFLLPQTETLMTFNKQGQYQSVTDAEPFVILGVHPYDVVAINQMDAVFQKDNYDKHYMARRQNATIVAVDIQNPSSNVFAAGMGTATVQNGFDVLLTLIGDSYVIDARTEKGEALLADIAAAPDADATDLARREQAWQCADSFLKMHSLNCKPEELPELLGASYDSELWAERADKCYSCGSCNLVCPTCYCFDVQDDMNWDLETGKRTRRWDGCMLSNFALVAGNHNFRKNKAERYRHRYYRKGKYLWDRMEQIACVGCGRCISACTTKIANPVEVYNALLEEK